MKLPRDLSGQELARLLRRLGYVVSRQKGSHIRLTIRRSSSSAELVDAGQQDARPESTEFHITIPAHDELKVGTLAAILEEVAAQLGLTRDELLEQLFG